MSNKTELENPELSVIGALNKWTLSNGADILALLKDCIRRKDIHKGNKVHVGIVRRGLLQKDIYVGNTLVNFYLKCGLLDKAQEVFDGLPVRNVVSWTTLISGYTQCGHGEKALVCFDHLQDEGLRPDAFTFVCALKACGNIGASKRGRELHAEIVRQDLLKTNKLVGNVLLSMYSRCNAITEAEELFNELPERNVISWTALITGYTQKGHSETALECFEVMQSEGIAPDELTYICILKACAALGDLDKGKQIHDDILRKGYLARNSLVGSALVDLYVKCGDLANAQEVLNSLVVRDVVSWTALIGGYAEHGLAEEALICFEKMQSEGVNPNATTFVCILKGCGSARIATMGAEIHAEIIRGGFLENDIVVGTTLVDMYAKCGCFSIAEEVFEKLPVRDVYSWTVLIAGYAQNGYSREALNCFACMQSDGIHPNSVTFVCILKACGYVGDIDIGKQIHSEIMKDGLLGKNVLLSTALIDMYSKCDELMKAHEVFMEISLHDICSWNALIGGCCSEEAWQYFGRMKAEGFSPDAVTYVCMLKACVRTSAIEKGIILHALVVNDLCLIQKFSVGRALVDMYVKCCTLKRAQKAFDSLPVQDLSSWNALIAGFSEEGYGEEAWGCLQKMLCHGLLPDISTVVCVLKACGSIGATSKGKIIHSQISKHNLLDENIVVGSALMDMYSNCGLISEAQIVFDELPVRDVFCWTALMDGYAHHGMNGIVFYLFSEMEQEGLEPNLVTLTVLLSACRHSGLVYEGAVYLEYTTARYNIFPILEHYICMVDLFGRAGQFYEVVSIIKKIPDPNFCLIWSTLLGACRKWGDVILGRWAFQQTIELNEKHTGAYVCMSNIWAVAAMEEDSF